MTKYRIIEVKEPLSCYYVKGVSEDLPKDISFSNPSVLLQERKSIFHKWKTIKQIDSIIEAEYYIYNKKVEKTKPMKKIIKKL